MMKGRAERENAANDLRILADAEKVAVVSRKGEQGWGGKLTWKEVVRVIGKTVSPRTRYDSSFWEEMTQPFWLRKIWRVGVI